MRKIFLALLIITLVFTTIGCKAPVDVPAEPTATPQPEVKPFRIGLMPANLFTEFYILLADTVKEEAAKTTNVEVEVLAPSLATAVDESMTSLRSEST